jgi:hypothetical protein
MSRKTAVILTLSLSQRETLFMTGKIVVILTLNLSKRKSLP